METLILFQIAIDIVLFAALYVALYYLPHVGAFMFTENLRAISMALRARFAIAVALIVLYFLFMH